MREHTENNHQDAEHPNMREQLDAMHADIRAARADAAEAKTAAERTGKALAVHVEQADAWQTAVEEDLSRPHRPLFAWRR